MSLFKKKIMDYAIETQRKDNKKRLMLPKLVSEGKSDVSPSLHHTIVFQQANLPAG